MPDQKPTAGGEALRKQPGQPSRQRRREVDHDIAVEDDVEMARIGMGKGGKVGREILVLKRHALPEMLTQHPLSAIAREAAAIEIISSCPQLPVGETANSAERRVGKECVMTCRTRCTQ